MSNNHFYEPPRPPQSLLQSAISTTVSWLTSFFSMTSNRQPDTSHPQLANYLPFSAAPQNSDHSFEWHSTSVHPPIPLQVVPHFEQPPLRISKLHRAMPSPSNASSSQAGPSNSSYIQAQSMLASSPTTPPATSTRKSSNARSTPTKQTPSQPQPPRPSNSFMLFRSDFVKRQIIPKDIEKRQQNLSKLAAMEWNSLSQAKRQFWDDEAKRVCEEHKMQNPGYKFQPSPRGSKKNKGAKSRAEAAASTQEHLDNVRMTYLNIPQAPPPSSRKKKKEQKKMRDMTLPSILAPPAQGASGSGSPGANLPHFPPTTAAANGPTPLAIPPPQTLLIPAVPFLQTTPTRNTSARHTEPSPRLNLVKAELSPLRPVMQLLQPPPVVQVASVSNFATQQPDLSSKALPRRPSTSLGFIESIRNSHSNAVAPFPRAGSTGPEPARASQQDTTFGVNDDELRLQYPSDPITSWPRPVVDIPVSVLSTPRAHLHHSIDSPSTTHGSPNWMPQTPSNAIIGIQGSPLQNPLHNLEPAAHMSAYAMNFGEGYQQQSPQIAALNFPLEPTSIAGGTSEPQFDSMGMLAVGKGSEFDPTIPNAFGTSLFDLAAGSASASTNVGAGVHSGALNFGNDDLIANSTYAGAALWSVDGCA